MAAKRTRLENYFNWRVRIILNDGRNLVGKLYATDKFLNVVLAETEEVRTVKGKKGADDQEQRRQLGFILLRGEFVISIIPEGAPPQQRDKVGIKATTGATGVPIGRGMPLPIAPSGPIPLQGGPIPLVPGQIPIGRGMPLPLAPGQMPNMPPPGLPMPGMPPQGFPIPLAFGRGGMMPGMPMPIPVPGQAPPR
ncbi:MAG: putative small nuclear ribonucleoprotein B and B' [Streblomastix strix]|uniref:Sm protein B n=1 Tax=Streblomastix strix TaxID=222440 RepID=A0A5J4W4S5_9EUKA|nr:MAG: putative small nuclear ribonucleoprotein B and B' [Streblomastix strix]